MDRVEYNAFKIKCLNKELDALCEKQACLYRKFDRVRAECAGDQGPTGATGANLSSYEETILDDTLVSFSGPTQYGLFTMVDILAVGGGGGGGGTLSDGIFAGGGGGGGSGLTSTLTTYDISTLSNILITIGIGGRGGLTRPSTDGTADDGLSGSATQVRVELTDTSTTLINAGGGQGGSGSTIAGAGNGGSGGAGGGGGNGSFGAKSGGLGELTANVGSKGGNGDIYEGGDGGIVTGDFSEVGGFGGGNTKDSDNGSVFGKGGRGGRGPPATPNLNGGNGGGGFVILTYHN